MSFVFIVKLLMYYDTFTHNNLFKFQTNMSLISQCNSVTVRGNPLCLGLETCCNCNFLPSAIRTMISYLVGEILCVDKHPLACVRAQHLFDGSHVYSHPTNIAPVLKIVYLISCRLREEQDF